MERDLLLRFRLDRSVPVPERESGHPAYCAKGIHVDPRCGPFLGVYYFNLQSHPLHFV